MVNISGPYLFLASLLCCAIGYTLLRYSKDGDLSLQDKKEKKYSNAAETTQDEAWERLLNLSNEQATEVTWNTSLFVSIISSFSFLAILDTCLEEQKLLGRLRSSTTGTSWLLQLIIIFLLQDFIIRWKNAHRKHASAKEKIRIIERLRLHKK